MCREWRWSCGRLSLSNDELSVEVARKLQELGLGVQPAEYRVVYTRGGVNVNSVGKLTK